MSCNQLRLKTKIKPKHQLGFILVNGFTLVEMMVVVSLTVILMLTATSLFLMTLVGNAKTAAYQQLKEEGEYSIAQIEFLLRNAVSLENNQIDPVTPQICETNMEAIGIKSIDNGITILGKAEDADDDDTLKIASNSAFLSSSSVTLVNGPIFDCQLSDDGTSAYVKVTFTLRKGEPGIDEARDIVTQTFTTGVNIRSIN